MHAGNSPRYHAMAMIRDNIESTGGEGMQVPMATRSARMEAAGVMDVRPIANLTSLDQKTELWTNYRAVI